MNLNLVPIGPTWEDNQAFADVPELAIVLPMSIEFFKRVGYHPPWIGYLVTMENTLVGMASFKGQPVNNRVEIAYGTMDEFQHKGIGSAICRELVLLSLRTDPSVRICARTWMEENYSVKLLRKNNFEFKGIVVDEEDGEVWEWEFKKG